jgi:hypothetical protein
MLSDPGKLVEGDALLLKTPSRRFASFRSRSIPFDPARCGATAPILPGVSLSALSAFLSGNLFLVLQFVIISQVKP